MKSIRTLSLAVLLFTGIACFADSPLTSTDFAKCYSDCKMVAMAQNLTDTELNTSLLSFLSDPKSPVDQRVAVVNAVGWNFNGKTTGDQLKSYLMKKLKVKKEEDLAKKLDSGSLITYAYAKAMSDYFDVKDAMALAETAVKKNKKGSFSINLIAALIRAQYYMDFDWSAVYNTVHEVLNDGALNLDMRQDAIDAIWDYVKLYKPEE
ncbi:MAG: hypothetical protein J6X81_04530 [Muribaculaceae bacterium]|nr:hypothetical protein [Muribaculaceae bacterium]